MVPEISEQHCRETQQNKFGGDGQSNVYYAVMYHTTCLYLYFNVWMVSACSVKVAADEQLKYGQFISGYYLFFVDTPATRKLVAH